MILFKIRNKEVRSILLRVRKHFAEWLFQTKDQKR